nr:retrovirus-related Pol polyprotein from transposon TNT 1-94 [Tanacetum cinerariifolium]
MSNYLSPTKPEQDLSHTTRPSVPIIEDWVSDSEAKSETKATQFVPSFAQSSEHVKSPRHSNQPIETTIPAATPVSASPKSNSSGKKGIEKLVLPVSAALPSISMTRPRYAHHVVTKSKSPIKRHITRRPTSKTSTSPPRATAVKAPVVSAAQGNHKGGKITGKGKIKIGKLDFDDVYFVKELKFNLFSVSQMCDKKNSVLFTDTKCLVLSPDFKLSDDIQVLLRVPRENNMYNAEAVNTACYVQNRVLVTKPHNKTSYELLHGKTPSIGFMRPFGCPVTTLNTLEPLGKFQGKIDEGFLVGYSVCSKGFRVFNSRTRIIIETLHVNFLENKPSVVGTGPTWLFDIDSVTRTMNYHPVTAENQTNFDAGFQENFDAEKVREEVDQTYVLFLVWSTGSTNPQNNDEDAALDGKEHYFDATKHESVVILFSSSSAQTKKQDDKTKKEDKEKSPVESFTGYRDLNAKFEDCSENSKNEVNVAGSIVPTVRQNSLNSTNIFSAADMPELEDITYSDDEDVVGAEAAFNNLESSISVSH